MLKPDTYYNLLTSFKTTTLIISWFTVYYLGFSIPTVCFCIFTYVLLIADGKTIVKTFLERKYGYYEEKK